MSGLEVGGGVLAAISLALTTTHGVYRSISGMKHTYPFVKQVSHDADSLKKLLQQLRSYGDELENAADLPDLVADCLSDVQSLEENLHKILRGQDSKLSKFAQRLKFVFTEQDWVKKSGVLQQHHRAISLQLDIIAGRSNSAQTAQLVRMEHLADEQLAQQTTHFETTNRAMRAANGLHQNLARSVASARTSNHETVCAVNNLSDKIGNLSFSEGQLDILKSHIGSAVQQSIRQSETRDANVDTCRGTQTDPQPDSRASFEALRASEDVQSALHRLGSLASEKEKTVFSTEAEDLLQDVKSIFFPPETLRLAKLSEPHAGFKRSASPCDSDGKRETDGEFQRHAKRMKRHLGLSGNAAINDKVCRKQLSAPGEYTSEYCYFTQETINGVLSTLVRTRRCASKPSSSSANGQSNNNDIEYRDIRAEFLSREPNNILVTALIQQRITSSENILTKPNIVVSMTLPDDAEAFELIKAGNLDGLIESLNSKRTRLTDRDLEGRCLLNVSTAKDGEDVENSSKAEECKALLLDSGFDPMLDAGGCNSLREDCDQSPCAASIKMLFDHGQDFHLLERKNLFLLDHLHTGQWTEETVRLLLEIGQDASVFDPDGTVLHPTVQGGWKVDLLGVKHVLKLLVQHGADIFALAHDGYTVVDIVLDERTEWRQSAVDRGTENGRDLPLRAIWKSVLEECGYDWQKVCEIDGASLIFFSQNTDNDTWELSLDEQHQSTIRVIDKSLYSGTGSEVYESRCPYLNQDGSVKICLWCDWSWAAKQMYEEACGPGTDKWKTVFGISTQSDDSVSDASTTDSEC
ncbi:uncharacterized protein KY384_008079 [Bacidia gigantensis]|uniref:uncharacterized protein n=1 Tax=Bacidia gigantensis TaxID=2732470 RepID=UPI001D046634|nr:uncharacterized protein KY384_008079 [Bacidia gigantensis]KAG8526650.1 hypothetical protein KY384_008079 [Bacidia gigantensis]